MFALCALPHRYFFDFDRSVICCQNHPSHIPSSYMFVLWTTKALIDAFIFPTQRFSSFPEGFHSWMWKGLSFLLPFLYAAYFFQAYNAYTLFVLSRRPDCTEWQVIVLAGIFALLCFGNTITTSHVVYQKFRGKLRDRIRKHLNKMDKDKTT